MLKIRHTLIIVLSTLIVSLAGIITVVGCFLSLFTLISLGIGFAYVSRPDYADRDEGIGILFISFVISLVITIVIFIVLAFLAYLSDLPQRLWSNFEQRFLRN